MKSGANDISKKLTPDRLKELNQRHLRAALVRSITSLSMWIFALIAYLLGILKVHHLIGISVSVLYLVLINAPLFIALLKITSEYTLANSVTPIFAKNLPACDSTT